MEYCMFELYLLAQLELCFEYFPFIGSCDGTKGCQRMGWKNLVLKLKHRELLLQS